MLSIRTFILKVIFRHGIQSANNDTTRVDVFMVNKDACKTIWAIHVSKIRVKGLATFESDLKVT